MGGASSGVSRSASAASMPLTPAKVTMNRPRWADERTTSKVRPSSAVSTEPTATRSSRLVVSETMTSPRSPWGFTIRPTPSSAGGSGADGGPPAPSAPSPGAGQVTGGSVVDDVDAGLNAVARTGGSHHGADGLGHSATAADHPTHVLGRDMDAEADAVATLLGVDHHGFGVRGDGVDQVGDDGQRRPPGDPVAGVIVVIVELVVDGVDVVHRVRSQLVGHWAALADANSSRAPDCFSSFSTRSVGWAPWDSHFTALALSISTTASGSASDLPRGA